MGGTKWRGAVLALAVVLMTTLSGCQKPFEEEPGPKDYLEKTLDYYRRDKVLRDSWWEVAALYGAGILPHEEPWTLHSWTPRNLDPGSAPTEYAGSILGLLAAGRDPWEWQGRSLPAELASLQGRDGSFGSSINHTIWAMLALEITGFPYFREEALDHLLRNQRQDGGFSLAGSEGDPDVTAMALLALSFQRSEHPVEKAVEEALGFLAGALLPSGGYASFNQENANSTAMVLSALVALGEDTEGETWKREGKGLLEALLAYRLEDGSFSFLPEPPKGDPMATSQALVALGDVRAGTSLFARLKEEGERYRREGVGLEAAEPPVAEPAPGVIPGGGSVTLTSTYPHARIFYSLDGGDPLEEGKEYREAILLDEDTVILAALWAPGWSESPVVSLPYSIENIEEETKPEPNPAPKPSPKPPETGEKPKPPPPATLTVELRVVGENRTYYNGSLQVPLDRNNALQALLAANLEVREQGGFVIAIEGEANAGISGWKYKVNSHIPGVSAAQYTLKENDVLLWWYADTPLSEGP